MRREDVGAGETIITVPRLMTVNEVASVLRCSRSKAYKMIYAGEIPTIKIAGKTVCLAKDIETYIINSLMASGRLDSAGESTKPSDTTRKEIESGVLSARRRRQRLNLS